MQFRKFITQAEGFDGVGREKLNPFVSAVVFMVIYFDKVNSFFFFWWNVKYILFPHRDDSL